MVWPIIGSESYLAEIGKSTKAEEFGGPSRRRLRSMADRPVIRGGSITCIIVVEIHVNNHINARFTTRI
jgi:hypothetical protein